jgi:hypothetical protein
MVRLLRWQNDYSGQGIHSCQAFNLYIKPAGTTQCQNIQQQLSRMLLMTAMSCLKVSQGPAGVVAMASKVAEPICCPGFVDCILVQRGEEGRT